MKEKIVELKIDNFDNETGVEIMSLVTAPAIEVGWVAMSEQNDDNIIHVNLDEELNSDIKIAEAIIAMDVITNGEMKETNNCYVFKKDDITVFIKNKNEYKLAAIDEDKRIITGPFMIPNQPIKRIDENGKIYSIIYSEDTIKKVSEKFFKTNKQNNTDINHSDDVTKNNTLLESWIVEDSEKDKSVLYGFNLPIGSWMGTYKINDDATWDKIKSGELNGFSITGYFYEK